MLPRKTAFELGDFPEQHRMGSGGRAAGNMGIRCNHVESSYMCRSSPFSKVSPPSFNRFPFAFPAPYAISHSLILMDGFLWKRGSEKKRRGRKISIRYLPSVHCSLYATHCPLIVDDLKAACCRQLSNCCFLFFGGRCKILLRLLMNDTENISFQCCWMQSDRFNKLHTCMHVHIKIYRTKSSDIQNLIVLYWTVNYEVLELFSFHSLNASTTVTLNLKWLKPQNGQAYFFQNLELTTVKWSRL